MNNLDICHALSILAPGAEWNLSGDSLDGLTWLDTVQTRPTDDAITAAIAAYVPPVSLQDQIATLQAQIAQLLDNQGK